MNRAGRMHQTTMSLSFALILPGGGRPSRAARTSRPFRRHRLLPLITKP